MAEYVVPALCGEGARFVEILGKLEAAGLLASQYYVQRAVEMGSIRRVKRGRYASAY